MRRLLQFATMMLMLTALIVPLAEFFDRWDAPGLGSDSETGVFCLILLVCLVLLVCRLVASSRLRVRLARLGLPQPVRQIRAGAESRVADDLFSPPRATPLRI